MTLRVLFVCGRFYLTFFLVTYRASFGAWRISGRRGRRPLRIWGVRNFRDVEGVVACEFEV